ncbi:apoptosis-enhancing nuclease [Gopherus flavomarginatus]|uniref:apoptosis-enhancing nuclease n=1 Tax=Gopherus flavomarginatus TaxID=286002 RepID=UPI0021CBDC95|nr:apoptosis-enhancing nuclease [Gopherus flavomarginatus]
MWEPLQQPLPGKPRVGSRLAGMSSGQGLTPGVVSTVKACEVRQKGANGQFLGCSKSRWGQCCPPPKAHLARRADVEDRGLLQSQNKKKSRKHQRFMERRTLLEQRGLLRPKLGHRTEPMAFTPSKEGLLNREASRCGRLASEDVSLVNNQSVGKVHVKLPKLKRALLQSLPVPPEDTAGQCSLSLSQDSESRLPLPASSNSGRVSLSHSLKKPRKCVAIDCEMVGTGPGGKQSELARCTVVNYNGDVIYDKYIRPELPIVDYRTRWSGITKQHMQKATPFSAAQREILKILKDKIVVGHAIHNDFRALKYFHPRSRTRDTSRIPLLNRKAGLPVKVSASLKSLARQLLHKKIQVGQKGHSSVEDARTSMELYRLVEMQWEQELASSYPSSPPHTPTDSCTDSDHYMEDQYWPKDLNIDCK